MNSSELGQFLDFVTSNAAEVIKHLDGLGGSMKESLDQRRGLRSHFPASKLEHLDKETIQDLQAALGPEKYQELESIFKKSAGDSEIKPPTDSTLLDIPKPEEPAPSHKTAVEQVSTIRFSAPDFRQARLDSSEIPSN